MILLVSATLRLVAVHALLAVLGAARTRRLIDRSDRGAIGRERAERAARAIQRVARRLPLRTNCLDQALALTWVLRASGIQATLRFGVRRDDEALAAHAWVEHDGQPLLDDAPLHYTTLTGAR